MNYVMHYYVLHTTLYLYTYRANVKTCSVNMVNGRKTKKVTTQTTHGSRSDLHKKNVKKRVVWGILGVSTHIH